MGGPAARRRPGPARHADRRPGPRAGRAGLRPLDGRARHERPRPPTAAAPARATRSGWCASCACATGSTPTARSRWSATRRCSAGSPPPTAAESPGAAPRPGPIRGILPRVTAARRPPAAGRRKSRLAVVLVAALAARRVVALAAGLVLGLARGVLALAAGLVLGLARGVVALAVGLVVALACRRSCRAASPACRAASCPSCAAARRPRSRLWRVDADEVLRVPARRERPRAGGRVADALAVGLQRLRYFQPGTSVPPGAPCLQVPCWSRYVYVVARRAGGRARSACRCACRRPAAPCRTCR